MEQMDRHAVDTTVAEITAVKAGERRRLATVPTPLLAFALVDLGGVVATVLVGRFHLALYALPAFALAVWLSGRAFARRARTEGVQIAIRPWALTTVGLCIAGVSASRGGVALDIDAVSTVGPFLAQAVGLWLLGRWADSDELLGTSAVMVMSSVLTGALASGDVAVDVQFGIYGVVLLAAARYVKMRAPAT
jgi:hypothetical protein